MNQRLIESRLEDVSTRYRYDPLGRRIEKRTGDKVTTFVWDGDALVGDWIEDPTDPVVPAKGVAREWVYYPETFELLALLGGRRGPNTLLHDHNDPNGCPIRLTDSKGEVLWAASYTAWGQIARLHVGYVDNPIRLQGQYEDGETGIHYNRHRYFDPESGLFGAQDPIGLCGGLNPYQYAANSLGWIDPLGLQCKPGYQYRQGKATDPGLADFVNDLESRGIKVLGTNLEIIDLKTGSVVGEIDVLTANAAIQYKHGSSSAHAVLAQIQDRSKPFLDVPVVGFVRGAGGKLNAAKRTVQAANKKEPVTSDIEILVAVIK
ncbi:Rhs family protein [Methylocaldum marinum]|uniref:Rhs family protein n=1 Tax=Methylocaldum marinum TaxID=1432792 RepID=A0A250KMS4_9GAMM|nr:RHS repeat-associated core domain-containing protein [Methylocaldum marinum]BBA32864.1 Rhs family protein [Methylocaldum marinum]